MAIPKKIINFLDKEKIKREIIQHKIVYTAFDKSATLKVKQNIIGKTLIVRLDKEIAFVLIPCNKNMDLNGLKKIANALRKKAGEKAIKKIDFISEKWMKDNLKGIKLGAVPPFGNIWKLKTFADKGLLKNPKVIINTGDYSQSLKISPNEIKKAIPDLILGNFSKAKKK